MKKIILASQSKYRKELLQRLNIPFECMDSNLDENPFKAQYTDPKELTIKLAIEKAKAVQKRIGEESIIIGSDQVCHIDGEILGKSGSFEKSFQQLKHLQGKTHQLITSYAILYLDKVITHHNITSLKMKKLTDLQVNKYLSTDNPIDCAGSYKLELNGIGLFDKIDTEDYTAIIGLPLLSLSRDLTNLTGTVLPPEN